MVRGVILNILWKFRKFVVKNRELTVKDGLLTVVLMKNLHLIKCGQFFIFTGTRELQFNVIRN